MFRPFCFLKLHKTTLEEVPEVLLEVPEVALEVLQVLLELLSSILQLWDPENRIRLEILCRFLLLVGLCKVLG